jgi:GTP-binding protein LepA
MKMKSVYIKLEYDIPLASLISNFFDQLKNITSGYASMEYEFIDFFPVDLVKVAILVHHEEVPALSFLETRDDARGRAAKLLMVMKDVIPRQQFQIPLQASVGAKIIARENVSAFRKDVTAKLYGGDVTRRKKLLEKQKKGKKRLKQIGQVNIPQEAFLAILKT